MASTFHFIAIGGAVMHQLAIFLHQQGNRVSGSDDVIFDPALSQLKQNGLLPDAFGWDARRIDKNIDAVILGMHAKADNPELIRAKELGLPIYSFPAFIYERSKEKTRVVVAGSHGKTSITSMIMHILNAHGVAFDYLVGARISGFDTMVKVTEENDIIIIEGDEYLSSALDSRSKFLHYRPDIAVISGIAWDHINVFPTMESYLDTFRKFIASVSEEGILFYYGHDEYLPQMAAGCPGKVSAYTGFHSREVNGITTIVYDDGTFPVQVFGRHNMENLEAAVRICAALGVPKTASLEYLATFGGSAKRLELMHSEESLGLYLYRDFAHAPSKLRASLLALREKYPGHRLVGVFEMHTYSTLHPDFLVQYRDTMDCADEAALFLDAHALRIKGREDIPNDRLTEGFGRQDLLIFRDPEELRAWLLSQNRRDTVIALMSSGNFANLNVPALFDLLIVNM